MFACGKSSKIRWVFQAVCSLTWSSDYFPARMGCGGQIGGRGLVRKDERGHTFWLEINL